MFIYKYNQSCENDYSTKAVYRCKAITEIRKIKPEFACGTIEDTGLLNQFEGKGTTLGVLSSQILRYITEL